MSEFSEKQVSNLRVKIDRYSCIGSSNCIHAAPDFFELDDERICVFKETNEKTEQDIIVEACSVCSVNALLVFDEEGKQIVP